MSKYIIETESGSVYSLDTEAKTLMRQPGPDASKLVLDGGPLKYEKLLTELTVDTPLRLLWKVDDQWKVRSTTPIVTIVRE